MKKLLIVGAGGFGREALWVAERMNEAAASQGREPEWEIAGFLDDHEEVHGTMQGGYPVLGGCSYLGTLKETVYVVIAIGSAKGKRAVAKRLSSYGNVRFGTLVDPSVILSDRVRLGEGCILCAGTILTVDIRIRKHVILNLDCTVGHDSVIQDYVTVYPSVNISGNVEIGECAELGTGMQILQGKRIGKESVVGAGAVVVGDLPEKCTAVGVPARVIPAEGKKRS